jgi:hypothetical protein
MINKVALRRVIVTVFSAALCTDSVLVYAFDMCDTMLDKIRQATMKQSEWRGGNIYRDDYYGNPGFAPGYGYGPQGYGYGVPPASSYGYSVPAYAAPQPGIDALEAEIYQLELRLKGLEQALNHESSQRQSAQSDHGTEEHLGDM